MNLMEWAIEYQKKGYSVIPVSDRDKKPLVKWTQYQKEKASENQILEWWGKWPNAMIGIVTGAISGIMAVDADTQDAISKMDDLLPDSLLVPTVSTPRDGRHYHFSYSNGIRNSNDGLLHVRAEGGFITVPPSKRFDGKGYTWLYESEVLPTAPVSLVLYLKELALGLYRGSIPPLSTLSTSVAKLFEEGRRDEDLFHVANCLVKGGYGPKETLQVMEILARNCIPSFPEIEVIEKVKSAIQRAERRDRNLAKEVREWVEMSPGVSFLSTECRNCLHLSTREDEKNLSKILKDLCDEGVIERYGNKRGSFKTKLNEPEDIAWQNADEEPIPIEWPFNLHEIIETMPKSISVIAGRSNAGKTAFLFNLALMASETKEFKDRVWYWSSELEGPRLKKRIKKFGYPLTKWAGIHFKRRAEDFHDVVKPDDINIIDYLEIYKDFYEIGGKINQIFHKLNKGIAVIAIQKNTDAEYGIGGQRGIEKAELYLSLDRGKLKIVKGKNWKDDTKNPDGMNCEFKLVQGSHFYPGEWRSYDGAQRKGKDWTSEF